MDTLHLTVCCSVANCGTKARVRVQIQGNTDTPHLTVCCSVASCGTKAKVRLQIQGNTDTPHLTVVCPQGASAVTSDPVAGTLNFWTLNLIPPTLVEGVRIFPTESLDGNGHCMKITLQGCATDGQLLAGLRRDVYTEREKGKRSTACNIYIFILCGPFPFLLCLCFCLRLCLRLSPSLCVSVSLSLSVSVSPCLCISVSVCLSLLCSGTVCNHQPNRCAGLRLRLSSLSLSSSSPLSLAPAFSFKMLFGPLLMGFACSCRL